MLRMNQGHRLQAQLLAREISDRATDHVERTFERVREGWTNERRITDILRDEEGRADLVGSIFALVAESQFLWPDLPSPPLAKTLARTATDTYPVSMNLPNTSVSTSANPIAGDEAAIRAALGVFQMLLDQRIPWVRVAALDLTARTHVRLGEWNEAISIYENLKREFGAGTDASGIPIELGVQYELANIYFELGQNKKFARLYLSAYEQLVQRQISLPEGQTDYVASITRQALEDFFKRVPNKHAALQVRFEEIQHEEMQQRRDRALVQSLLSSGIAHSIADSMDRGGGVESFADYTNGNEVHSTTRYVNGALATLFWTRLGNTPSGKFAIGLRVDPRSLLRVMTESDLTFTSEEVQATADIQLTETPAPDLHSGVGNRVNMRVPRFPQLTVSYSPNEIQPNHFSSVAIGWTALLASIVLCGGVYAGFRVFQGRLQTATLQRDFVSVVTHELQTPLTSIRLFSEALRDQPERSAATNKQIGETIHRECRRLEHLVQNILAYAQTERGDMPTGSRKWTWLSWFSRRLKSFGRSPNRRASGCRSSYRTLCPRFEPMPTSWEVSSSTCWKMLSGIPQIMASWSCIFLLETEVS